MTSASSTDPLHRERLFPKAWVWLAAFGVVAALAVAYDYGLGPTAGALTLVIGLALATALLVLTSPVVEVTAGHFRAGRAHLPTEWIGKVSALDRSTSDAARTDQADPTAYLMLRTLAAQRTVIVEVTDPDDPHPYWLVSSRHPERLAEALIAVRPVPTDAGTAETRTP